VEVPILKQGAFLIATFQAALSDAGVRIDDLPHQLKSVLTWLSTCRSVPDLKILIGRASSTRTFYRSWNLEFPEPPRIVLDRLRTCHATALFGAGRTEREAAELAGFRNPGAMRRSMIRFGMK